MISAYPSSLDERLVNLEKTILSEYSALIITRIRSEVQITPDKIDFVDRANRYYLARKFTIIGELLKELPRAGEFSSLISSLQVISDVRDSLIHNHKQLLSIDAIAANNLKIYTQSLFVALLEATSSNLVNKGLEQTLSTISTLRNNSTSLLFALNKLEKKEAINEVIVSNKNEQDKLHKLIATANSKLNGKPVSHTWEQLNEEYLSLLSNLSSEMKKVYPPALNESQKMSIQESNQKIKDDKEAQKIKDDEIRKTVVVDKARDKLVDRLLQITNEYTYLQTIEASNISEGIKDYVRQHATNIIAENMEKIRDEKEETVAQDYNEISSSTLKSAQSKGIYLRKNGLSHDMFSFNSQKFDQILFDNIIPAKDDINSVYYILSNKESQAASAKIMNNIGVSYIRLGLYPQAVEILLKAQEFVKNNPLEIQKEKMKDFGLTNTDHVRFYDFDQMSIGIESYGYEITSNLAEAYSLNGQIDQSIALIQEILSKINLGSIESFSKDFRNSLASTVNSLATFYDSQNIRSALYLFEQAYKLALAEDALFIVGGNFIKYLDKIGNHTRATEIRDDLNTKANVYTEFVSKIDNCSKLIAKEDLIRAKILVDECKIFLEANEGKLRVLKGDRVSLLMFEVIRTRLDLAAKEPEYLDSKIQEIEANFREKYNSLEPNLQQSSDINNTYLFLSNAYATL
ncbi:MAG: hypothetical protein JKY53_13110, partial [Flavobacteriales bacterium]|nr:hypothetical protein [Flavobacteriales bacterium]